MTTRSKELNNLLQYFLVKNSPNHIISLALTSNDSLIARVKQQSPTIEHPSWDLFELENSSASFNNYIENSSSVRYTTNDTFPNGTTVGVKPRISAEIPIWLIPCYSTILIFAIVGNLLVASTLFQNRRMRTITNVFLVNLAISDMLLGVLCMPITLVGTYLRHFIFGELVCKFIQFAQAASVAVSSWTLVAISCERYYAICHPLRSRTWQTINHAYKIIACIWFGSMICMAPIAIFSQLIPTSRQGLRKCREQWPKQAVGYERFYNIFLDLMLLVLPLAILCVAYILITRTLYIGIKDEKALIFGSKNNNMNNGDSGEVATGDGKIYTQVDAEMKRPSVFHLNMSFRYHTRKGASSVMAGSNVIAECVNNTETLQVIKTSTKNNSRSNEAKCFKSSDVENKYSAMGSISSSAGGPAYGKRLRYNSLANTQAETEISFKKTKEQSNNLQIQPSLRQHCNDDTTFACGCDSGRIDPVTSNTMATTRTTATKKCKLMTKSLNALPTEHFTRTQHSRQSFNQKQQHLQQNPNNHEQLTQFHQYLKKTELTEKRKLSSMPSLRITESTLRRSNLEKNLESKKRVVKMLFVLVLEFFICWTPLYVINTVAMFIGPAIYEYVDYTTISFFQLLAYSSSCCNPITYCFMNASFRRAFVDTFKDMHLSGGCFCPKSPKADTNLSMAGNSIALANSCTVMTANTVLDSPRL